MLYYVFHFTLVIKTLSFSTAFAYVIDTTKAMNICVLTTVSVHLQFASQVTRGLGAMD
jgi:hypothetical protein